MPRWLIALVFIGIVSGSLALPLEISESQSRPTIYVVVNARTRVRSMSKPLIRSMYLGRRLRWKDGRPVRAFLRSVRDPATRMFMDRVMGMTYARYRRSWTSRQLSGQGMAPSRVSSVRSLAQRVATTPGALGYMTGKEIRRFRSKRIRPVPIRR